MAHKYKFKTVKLADIDASNRYREDMGNIDELAAGIEEKGLIQPLCVNSDLRLLAGGRRHAACTKLGLIDVPVLVREGNDELDGREIELMENIHRKEMTWQEQAKLTAAIHGLYQAKDPDWSQRKTAQLIDQNPMNVSRALTLARAMEVNPGIAICKTADDAHKVIKKAEENAIVAELVKRQKDGVDATNAGIPGGGMSKGTARMLEIADGNYIVGDVFLGMAALKNTMVDFIECDPPYGVALPDVADRADRGAAVRQRDDAYVEIADEHYPEFLEKLTKELYRVASKDCWMVFWFAFRWYPQVLSSLQEAGWKVDVVPAMWIKDTGRTPRPDLLLGRSYEPFVIAKKGNPTIIKQGTLNTFITNPEKVKYHPAQRPVQLMEDILNTFLDEGRGTVFVPFLGSGATLRACYNLGHRGFGFDTNNEYKDKFLLAVEEDTKQLLSKD